VKVRCGEGLAIHTGPEPCVGAREGGGEASAGEPTGQPLRPRSKKVPGAHVVEFTEGTELYPACRLNRSSASVSSGVSSPSVNRP
jgi:hypothetical protein